MLERRIELTYERLSEVNSLIDDYEEELKYLEDVISCTYDNDIIEDQRECVKNLDRLRKEQSELTSMIKELKMS